MLIKIDDAVSWRGEWGSAPIEKAKITHLTVTTNPGEKYGDDYKKEVSWELVKENRVVVGLDNGHWAYSYQIAPEGKDPKTYHHQPSGYDWNWY